MKLKALNLSSQDCCFCRTSGVDATRPIVFLIDYDESERKSIKRLLNSARYEAEVFESASDFLLRAAHAGPACVIVAVHVPRLNGIDLQEALIQLRREEQLVFISENGNIRMCAKAMQVGAVDFLQKPYESGELLRSVERALDRSVEQRRHACDKVEAIRLLALLTPRELEVMQLVIIGLLNKEIADELGMAEKTVKVHRGHVMQKLGVRSVPEVIRLVQNAEDGPVYQAWDPQHILWPSIQRSIGRPKETLSVAKRANSHSFEAKSVCLS